MRTTSLLLLLCSIVIQSGRSIWRDEDNRYQITTSPDSSEEKVDNGTTSLGIEKRPVEEATRSSTSVRRRAVRDEPEARATARTRTRDGRADAADATPTRTLSRALAEKPLASGVEASPQLAAEKKKERIKAAKAKQEEEEKNSREKLAIVLGVSFGIIALIAIGIIVFCVIKKKRAAMTVCTAVEKKEEKNHEYKNAAGLTVLVRNGKQKSVIKGEDFNDMGPLVRNSSKFDVNKEYGLDNQAGDDKPVDEYFFDKNENKAYRIGEGVEIVKEEDSVSVKPDEKGDGFIEDADVEQVQKGNHLNESPKVASSSKSSKSKKGKKGATNPAAALKDPSNKKK